MVTACTRGVKTADSAASACQEEAISKYLLFLFASFASGPTTLPSRILRAEPRAREAWVASRGRGSSGTERFLDMMVVVSECLCVV